MKHPLAIFIQSNTFCNAKCKNCPHSFTYGSEGAHKKGKMSNEVWNKIVEDPEDRRKIFAEFGYETLVIWENELKNMKKVERKIKKFIEG